ncbi:MAG: phosphoserine phosphatase RsbU/P [Mycobacterium sp.]|nr:phosphoserine phosphatase RsbU/P [Mycobacterium sp.]
MTHDPDSAVPVPSPGSGVTPPSDVLDHAAHDLYEHAPCGYLAAWPDRRIAEVNTTLAAWLGYERKDLVGKRFTDLLTAGGRIHYETHFAPLLQMKGQLSGIAVDLIAGSGARLPVFLAANVKTDADGNAILLRITIHEARDRRSYELELLEARQRAERERARAQELASTLQRSLLPPALAPPQGLEASAYYHTASADDVGGDFYDLFPLSQQKWGFFLGDVSGKGAGAAAATSLTRYTLRAAAVYDDDPVAVLHNLDTVLNHEFHGDDPRFCTVIFGVLTGRDHGFDIDLASGGHPPALLLGADGRADYVDTAGGQAVGILPDARFVSTRIRLGAGDTLVLYTDGLTEARIGTGSARYDHHGALLEFAAAHAPTSAAAVVEAIRSLLVGFGTGVEDDTAVLALGVPHLPAGADR